MNRGSGLRVAIVAGETSGDSLGAGLIRRLREREPDAAFFGIAGPRMLDAGCTAWHSIDELSVMGLAEVLPHLRRLLKLRAALVERIREAAPDVYVGVDSSDFNLPIELALKQAGIPTVQYVSPQVWAWRQSRVTRIRAATELVLCLLPFEPDFYARHGVNARFVGHPLADDIPFEVDAAAARAELGLEGGGPLLALLPGSRRNEVRRLITPFLETAAWLAAHRPGARAVVAAANGTIAELCRAAAERVALDPEPALVTGRARECMAAADVVLSASGTASLEATLLKRPLVVAHKLSPFTYWLARRLGVARFEHFSLPNLLAGREIAPEYAQRRVRADILGPAVAAQLEAAEADPDWARPHAEIHERLRRGASSAAASAVLELLNRAPAERA